MADEHSPKSTMSLNQGLSQHLEVGCLIFAIANFWGVLFFKGDHNHTQIITTKIYILNQIKQNVHKQCNGTYINPSNAEATSVQSTKTQRFLKIIQTLSCWYSLDSSC